MFKKRTDQSFLELNETLVRFAFIAEVHEWDNRKHLERIRRFTLAIATAMGLSHDEALTISLASQLHDIGKVMTPIELLKRSGNYEPAEWDQIEKHTIQGAKILESESSTILQTASIIALTHHERWDGSGYPQHLKGEEIPLSGRICAIADVFDALTTKRSYKNVILVEEALRLIKESSGVLFDPKVVIAFENEFSEILKIKENLN